MKESELAKYLLIGGKIIDAEEFPTGYIVSRKVTPSNRLRNQEVFPELLDDDEPTIELELRVKYIGRISELNHLYATDYVVVIPIIPKVKK